MKNGKKISETAKLILATGMTYGEIGELLDVSERSVMRYVAGERTPQHPAMLHKALQLILLEKRGVITERLIEMSTN